VRVEEYFRKEVQKGFEERLEELQAREKEGRAPPDLRL